RPEAPPRRSAADVDAAVALDDLGATERPDLRQLDERGVETGHLLEPGLRPDDHPAGVGVVAGLVPGAHETPVRVDRPLREIRAQMTAAARDGKALTVDVEDRPVADSPYRSGSELLSRSHELLRHRETILGPRRLRPSTGTRRRACATDGSAPRPRRSRRRTREDPSPRLARPRGGTRGRPRARRRAGEGRASALRRR